MTNSITVGTRVYVTDPALAALRYVMAIYSGKFPTPNHHGTVERVKDASVYIVFDDGGSAPYDISEVFPLEGAGE
jgi:hypothetical protein